MATRSTSSPAKILLCKQDLSILGGLEKYTQQIADHLSMRGHKVTILTERLPLLYNPSLNYQLLPPSQGPGFYRITRFNQLCQTWIKNQNISSLPDLILGVERTTEQTHFRAGNGTHLAYLASRKQSESFLKQISFSINPLHHTLLRLEKEAFTYPGLRKLFTNSHMAKQEILSYYPLDEKKISVIHNGVEWHRMEDPFLCWEEIRLQTAKKLKLEVGIPILLFVGNNYKRKGLDLLLSALARGKMEEFVLLIIGKDKEILSYKRQAERLGLSKKVLFLGPQVNILPFYQLSDICIQPSLYDPFANVTIEALAMGLFVITTTKNGASEILSPETGLIVDPEVDPLIAALKRALTVRKSQKSAYSIRKSVEQLDFSSQITQLIEEMVHE